MKQIINYIYNYRLVFQVKNYAPIIINSFLWLAILTASLYTIGIAKHGFQGYGKDIYYGLPFLIIMGGAVLLYLLDKIGGWKNSSYNEIPGKWSRLHFLLTKDIKTEIESIELSRLQKEFKSKFSYGYGESTKSTINRIQGAILPIFVLGISYLITKDTAIFAGLLAIEVFALIVILMTNRKAIMVIAFLMFSLSGFSQEKQPNAIGTVIQLTEDIATIQTETRIIELQINAVEGKLPLQKEREYQFVYDIVDNEGMILKAKLIDYEPTPNQKKKDVLNMLRKYDIIK